MCGICGIFHLDGKPVLENQIEQMNQTMAHRGPDGEGVWVDGSIGLGHRRLSIIDLSTGEQPMSDPEKNITVVFNGEIYNFLELKEVLSKKGYLFRTTSDTETIIYAYLEWGDEFVQRLRGMFAIGLWDNQNHKLVLVRDRIGKKPLYYHFDGKRLLFASELKALLIHPDIDRTMDYQALDAYLSFGYVPAPLSIFQEFRKLRPGYMAVCSPGGMYTREYWDLDMSLAEPFPDETTVQSELLRIFDESVRLRLISDVPLGAFLSGGVDSGAVVASMALGSGNDKVKTASIGFSDKKYDELDFARIVAKKYDTDHTEFTVNPDALEILDKIVWHFDEPFADSSAIPTYYVSKMARQKVTVVLSGDGGDETFAGYINRYSMNLNEARIRDRIPKSVRTKIIGPIAAVYPKIDSLPRPLRLKNFLRNISLSFEQAYYRDMSFYFTPEMKQSLYSPDMLRKLSGFDTYEIPGRFFKRNNNPDYTSRVQYVDMKTYLPEDILVKVDRMSMANSLEVRSPILDHTLMEFVGKLHSSFKLRGGQSKYIFKKMNESRLPNEILYRKKQGFRVPLAEWIRGEIREYTREVLFSTGTGIPDFFEKKYIDAIWKGHQSGLQDYSSQIWGLMMFELWRKKFM